MNLPKNIKLGGMKTGHIQGIATDAERKYMYYSFTTSRIKTDMEGNVIGRVDGLCGHLGCIAYNYDDGMVYGSLEFKHDAIGKPILSRVSAQRGEEVDVEDGFYIARFDVKKIDRVGMDAEKDGVMTAIFLSEVTDDYNAEDHRHGCSGIDGITFAPVPGEKGKMDLYVAYGIYLDLEREDNDNQVILRYDWREFDKYATPLNQQKMHRIGPKNYADKYFVYTGNTRWGVQNLEYVPENDLMLLAVYKGEKPAFPNYPMFAVDMTIPAKDNDGRKELTLAKVGVTDEKTGISGIDFPYGSTGVISLGDGKFYFSKPSDNDGEWNTEIVLYSFDGVGEFSEL